MSYAYFGCSWGWITLCFYFWLTCLLSRMPSWIRYISGFRSLALRGRHPVAASEQLGPQVSWFNFRLSIRVCNTFFALFSVQTMCDCSDFCIKLSSMPCNHTAFVFLDARHLYKILIWFDVQYHPRSQCLSASLMFTNHIHCACLDVNSLVKKSDFKSTLHDLVKPPESVRKIFVNDIKFQCTYVYNS